LASPSLAALAAVPDGLAQLLGYAGDTATCWAWHYSEQDVPAARAYERERGELGPYGVAQILELPRPRQDHVIWTDRHHLLARSPAAGTLTRLLGLYVGDKGRFVGAVHDVSVSQPVGERMAGLAQNAGADWDEHILVDQCRFVVRYDHSAPDRIAVTCPALFRPQTQAAFPRLAEAVAGW